jgi:cysteine desulfuration protein SufE
MNIQNMTIEEIVDNFRLLEDWEERYRYLIELGQALPDMPENLKTEDTSVKGCMSKVWMLLAWDGGGNLSLSADSDSQIVKGLIAVLHAAFQGKTPEAAARVDMDGIFRRLELDRHLSPNRRNGFYEMTKKIRAFISRDT